MDVDLSGSAQSGGGGGGGGDDITSELLQKFSCMNTNDREVLVQQFKLVLGEKCSENAAEFWLDMNNWNLQAAVCAYFDNESSITGYLMKLPSVLLVPDPTLPETLPPGTPFTYRCTLMNSGDEIWPLGCSLRFCGGATITADERILLPQLTPGQSFQVALNFTSPDTAGYHQSLWRPATITGQFFGETIYIILHVVDVREMDPLAEQLSAAHLSGPARPTVGLLDPQSTTSSTSLSGASSMVGGGALSLYHPNTSPLQVPLHHALHHHHNHLNHNNLTPSPPSLLFLPNPPPPPTSPATDANANNIDESMS